MHKIFANLPGKFLKCPNLFLAAQLINLASCSKAYAGEVCNFLVTSDAIKKFAQETKLCNGNERDLKLHFIDYGMVVLEFVQMFKVV